MTPDDAAQGVPLRSALGEPLVGIAACFAAGIAFNERAAPGFAASYAFAAVALLVWIWRDKTATLWLFCFAAAGLLHFLQTGADRSAPHFDRIATGPLGATVEGVVASAPRISQTASPGARFSLRLERIEVDGASDAAHHNLIAVDMRGTPDVRYGDRIRLTGTLREPRPPRNPAAFDYAGYLRQQGIYAELLTDSERAEVLGTGAGNPLVAFGLRGREWVSAQLTRGLGSRSADERALILAMTLGARDETPEVIEDKFRYSGTLHVFAVSGLHVGIVAALAWLASTMLAPLLHIPRKAAVLATIVAVIAYALITGLRPSAVRAAVMASIFFGGMLIDREPQIFNSTGAAALAILLFDTDQLFRPGFQLSFCVLLCIAAFATPISARLARPFQRDPFLPKSLVTPRMRWSQAGARKVAGLAGMSTAAWAGSVLLTWYYFGLLTPISIVANLLLIPLAFLVLGTAAFSVSLAPVPHPLPAELANEANAFWVKAAAASAGTFSEMPGAHWSVPAPEHLLRAPCEITVLDLPYGGAASHIALRGGADWLIDTGSDRAFRGTTHPLLRAYGAGRLDGLLLTHGDADHVGGGVTAIGEYRPRRVITTPADSTSRPWRDALAAAGQAGVEVERPAAGDSIDLGRGATLHVLYPPAAGAPGFVADDRCLVTRLDLANGWRVLFIADAGFYTERWLAEHDSGGELRCDVLVRGSHEGDDSTLPGLIALAAPDAVVLSGQSSRAAVRLPADWAADLRSKGVAVFDQRESGAVTIRFRGDRAELRAFLGDQSISLKRAE